MANGPNVVRPIGKTDPRHFFAQFPTSRVVSFHFDERPRHDAHASLRCRTRERWGGTSLSRVDILAINRPPSPPPPMRPVRVTQSNRVSVSIECNDFTAHRKHRIIQFYDHYNL